MYLKTWALFQLRALSIFAGSPEETQKKSIQWANCSEVTGGIPAECGTLPVPLDYTDTESKKTLNISMLKVKATAQPFKGSILINPGGPGEGGVGFMSSFAALMLVMTGGHFDVIGFDPRGTGQTLPIECFKNPFDRIRYELLSPPTLNASDTALGNSWAFQKAAAEACYENAGDVGELMGTGFVVRDMMQIVDALDEDGMLRYFGQSYGTYLGTTVAAMFPDRIDKLVLDGVINPQEYDNGWEYDPVPVGELTLEKFLDQCVKAGRPACPLAGEGVTTQDLVTRIHDLVETVKYEPIVLGSNVTTEVVGLNQIMTSLNTPLRIPISYAESLAGYLNAIFERNVTEYHIHRPKVVPEIPLFSGGYDGVLGIRCSDTKFHAETLDNVRPQVEKMISLSPIFGAAFASSSLPCSAWKMRAKGQYEGNYQAKTKNPALLIGSPYDLRTPLVSAHNVSAGLEGSVVLQHNGLGHCLMYSPGQCAIKAVQDYFTNGTLPQPGTICEQDFGVFDGKSILDSFGLGKE